MNCSLGRTRWGAEETETLCGMKAAGHTNIKIAAAMRRTVASVKERWRWINISEDRLDKKRTRNRNSYRRINGEPTLRRVVLPEVRTHVVEALLRDRAARGAVSLSITQMLCGDPPPGWSALDRKREGVRP